MRIVELRLDAFGPFSGRTLAFGDGGDTGLCVVHGPNEAGKSTALRAIRGLFYGIPHESPDNFVHAHQDLRVGARLRFQDGFSVDLVRRKGRKQTLQGEGDRGPQGVERLLALTQAVPESLFTHFYGLDHPALVEGSRALLEDGGELGRALFGAGLGVAHLRKLIEQLEAEAAALFVPRGQKQRIALDIAEWKALQAEIRAASLEPSRFEEQSRRVRDLELRLAALERDSEETQARVSRARRLKEARLALAQAEQEHADAQERIERETAREAALVLSPALLAAREPIEALHQGLERYRATRAELPRREERAAELASQIAALEAGLGRELGAASEALLRRIIERAPRVRDLVAEAARCEDRLEKARDAERELRAELARLTPAGGFASAALPGAAPAPDRLTPALSRARKLGPLDDEIEQARRDLMEAAGVYGQLQEQLQLAAFSADVLETLPLPPRSLIERHARRFDEHAQEDARLRRQRGSLAEERRSVDEALGRLRGEGSLPSEAELAAARQARDELWRSLRRPLLDPGTAMAGDASDASELGERFEARMRDADWLADRLRSEAQRVAEGAALVARATRLDEALAALAGEASRHEAERARLEAEWSGTWPVVLGAPGAPETRIEWRASFERLLELGPRRRELEERLERKQALRQSVCAALGAALDASTGIDADREPRLEVWLERAEQEQTRRLAEGQRERDAALAREQAERQVERAVRQRDQAAEQLERWRGSWQAELEAVALPLAMRARDAERELDAIQRLLERRREREELERRIDQMRAFVRGFEVDCDGLVASCLPAIADFTADVAALRLKRQLDEAREQATLAEAARIALAEARDQLARAERRRAACAEELRERLGAADGRGGGEPGPSPEGGASGGADFLPELPVDVDGLTARIASLEGRLREQQAERTRCAGELGVQRAALGAMDGNDRNALLAEQAAARLARVGGDVRRHAELRLARQILESEIDAYRRQNQGPLLAEAGALFAELTRGAYPAILSDADEGGRARLVAVARAGREVAVEGLSAGTRDQLFLALRLATLAASLERAEPMPLIADDILIEFDDERTAATLEVLARFGSRTQILLFSHHRHVAAFAEGLADRTRVIAL